jgi:hypothetical protein
MIIQEHYKEPIFKTELKPWALYVLILPSLLIVLYFVLSSPNDILWEMLIEGLLFGSVMYLVISWRIPTLTVYRDCIEIHYPYLPLRKKILIPFKSIKGLFFDDLNKHQLIPGWRSKYYTEWIDIYYKNDKAEDQKRRIYHRYIPKGDMRRVVSLLRESEIEIRNDEEYLHLT